MVENKIYNKLYIRLLLMVLSLLILTPFIQSKIVYASTEKQRIYDYAELLTRTEVKKLEELAAEHSSKRETDFIVLTSKDADGKDIVDYMADFYDENELGYDKAFGNTVILVLDMEERDVIVVGFYKGEEFLHHERRTSVRKKITPHLSEGEYYRGFKTFIETSSNYMAFKPRANPNSLLYNIWVQLAVSLLLGFGVVAIMTNRVKSNITVNEATYRDHGNSRILDQRDLYVRTSTSRIRKPDPPSSSGGGGGGFGGTTSGGHSFGGSRGKF